MPCAGEKRRGKEELAVFFTQDGEIGERSREGRNANHRSEDDADHRDAPTALHQTVQHFAGTCQRLHAVLRPLATAVPHGDEGCFCSFGHLNNLRDFQGVHLAHAAAVDAEILGKTVHSAAFDGALACDNTVTQSLVEKHVVVVGSVGYEGVNLKEGTLVEKKADAVPRCASSA